MSNFSSINNFTITLQNLSDTAFRVYCFLNSMCYGKKDNCYPSQETISKSLHKCVRTIQRAIRELVDLGLIKVKRRGSISNVYYILKKVALKAVSNISENIKNAIKTPKKSNTFNNFKQRNYNFSNLEDMLLGNMDYNSDKLKE